MDRIDRSRLASLRDEHRRLTRLIDAPAGPGDAVVVGRALLAFAGHEDAMLSRLALVIDPDAQSELTAEHRQIADDLELLEWLLQNVPESPDVDVLSASLLRRMQTHIERDGRLLSRAAAFQENG
jgi:hypothetical protein